MTIHLAAGRSDLFNLFSEKLHKAENSTEGRGEMIHLPLPPPKKIKWFLIIQIIVSIYNRADLCHKTYRNISATNCSKNSHLSIRSCLKKVDFVRRLKERLCLKMVVAVLVIMLMTLIIIIIIVILCMTARLFLDQSVASVFYPLSSSKLYFLTWTKKKKNPYIFLTNFLLIHMYKFEVFQPKIRTPNWLRLRIHLLQSGWYPLSLAGVFLRMTLNYIWWQSSNSGDLGSVKPSSFQWLPCPLWSRVILLVRVSSMPQIDLFRIYSFLIDTCTKRKPLNS